MAVRRAYKRRWARTHQDSVRRTNVKWRTLHHESYVASVRRTHKKYRARIAERKRLYHKRTYPMRRERIIRQTRAYAKAHPEVRARCCRNWARRYPEKVLANNAKKRARRRAADVGDKKADALIHRWRKQSEFICFYCKAKFGTDHLTVDHFVPITRGGLHTAKNLRKACMSCNRRKSNKLPHEFLPAGL